MDGKNTTIFVKASDVSQDLAEERKENKLLYQNMPFSNRDNYEDWATDHDSDTRTLHYHLMVMESSWR